MLEDFSGFFCVHETSNSKSLKYISHLTFAGGQINAFNFTLFHINSKQLILTRINRKECHKEPQFVLCY